MRVAGLTVPAARVAQMLPANWQQAVSGWPDELPIKQQLIAAAIQLLAHGVLAVVVTLGPQGVLLVTGIASSATCAINYLPALPCPELLDVTGAGTQLTSNIRSVY